MIIRFSVLAFAPANAQLGVVGSPSFLGNWQVTKCLPLLPFKKSQQQLSDKQPSLWFRDVNILSPTSSSSSASTSPLPTSAAVQTHKHSSIVAGVSAGAGASPHQTFQPFHSAGARGNSGNSAGGGLRNRSAGDGGGVVAVGPTARQDDGFFFGGVAAAATEAVKKRGPEATDVGVEGGFNRDDVRASVSSSSLVLLDGGSGSGSSGGAGALSDTCRPVPSSPNQRAAGGGGSGKRGGDAVVGQKGISLVDRNTDRPGGDCRTCVVCGRSSWSNCSRENEGVFAKDGAVCSGGGGGVCGGFVRRPGFAECWRTAAEEEVGGGLETRGTGGAEIVAGAADGGVELLSSSGGCVCGREVERHCRGGEANSRVGVVLDCEEDCEFAVRLLAATAKYGHTHKNHQTRSSSCACAGSTCDLMEFSAETGSSSNSSAAAAGGSFLEERWKRRVMPQEEERDASTSHMVASNGEAACHGCCTRASSPYYAAAASKKQLQTRCCMQQHPQKQLDGHSCQQQRFLPRCGDAVEKPADETLHEQWEDDEDDEDLWTISSYRIDPRIPEVLEVLESHPLKRMHFEYKFILWYPAPSETGVEKQVQTPFHIRSPPSRAPVSTHCPHCSSSCWCCSHGRDRNTRKWRKWLFPPLPERLPKRPTTTDMIIWEGCGAAENRKFSFDPFDVVVDVNATLTLQCLYICKIPHFRDPRAGGSGEFELTTRFYHSVKNESRMHFTRICCNIFLGSCPRQLQHIRYLKEELKVSCVFNLQTEEDLRNNYPDPLAASRSAEELSHLYDTQRIRFLWLPLADMRDSARRLAVSQAAFLLLGLIKSGHCVYVHCNAGVGRSVAAVSAFLCFAVKMDLRKANFLISAKRPVAYWDEKAMKYGLTDYSEKFGKCVVSAENFFNTEIHTQK